jgi:hypothetical protein
MIYYAILLPGTDIYRRWRGENRLSGVLDHTVFHWRGGQYVTDVLDAKQIAAFSNRQAQDVKLEAMGIEPEEIEAAEVEPDGETEEAPKKRVRL